MTQVHTGNAHRQIVDGQRVRGISRAGHPVVFGGLIGVVGGMAFLLAGIAGLPGDAQSMLRSAAVALAVFALAAVLLRRRTLPALPPPAQIALAAAVVGAHFLPFARAFGAPVFRWIGGSMLVLGLVGALAAMLRVPAAGPAGAAAAGAAMLLIVAGQALRQGAPAPGDRLRA